MTIAHVLWVPSIPRPWWSSQERFPSLTGKKLWTDCCCCKMPADETDARLVTSWDPPVGGSGCYQEQPYPWEPDRCPLVPAPPTSAWYDARIEVRCADGRGCIANPRKKNGQRLREHWRYGP